MSNEKSILIHAVMTDENGDSGYAEIDQAESFAVYVRTETPEDPQQPFDISDDSDHATLQDAIDQAKRLSVDLFNNPDQWEIY